MFEKKLELVPVKQNMINQLQVVIASTLPISYPSSFYKSIIKGSNIAYIAQVEGKSVGAVVWREEEDGSHLLCLGVYVLYRRRGVGSALLNLYIKHCQSKVVYLHVNADNISAIVFYQKFGFSIKARVENYYRGVQDNTALRMAKQIALS